MRLPFADAWEALTQRQLVVALLGDSCACVALLDARGTILRRGGGWPSMQGEGGEAAASLPEPASSMVRRALAMKRNITLATRLGDGPVSVCLTWVQAGRVAAVLRVTDTTRTHELEEALGQAQRLQKVGELAGGIAHDFNNLLTAILGAAEDMTARSRGAGRAIREVGEEEDEEDEVDLAQIVASADRGAKLVRQLLAFSQRQTMQPRVLVLDDAIVNAADLLRRLLGSKMRLVLDLKAPGRLVHMDATQLDQVLMNLVVNARNAMPDGGTITIATDGRLVLAPEETGTGTIPPGRYATLAIADTGCGIAPDVLPSIFDPFFTTRRDEGGTGLGLSMAQGIVRQSGGYLSVCSTLGQGTCFTITLPRHEAPEAMVAQAPPPPVPATPKPRPASADAARILVVDDDDSVRRLVTRALSRAGYTVVEADRAESALQTDLASIACVVSDVAMPGLDGPGLVRTLRQARAHLPSILISGYADAQQRQALAAEDIAFLAKPFSMAELIQTVAASLAAARISA